MKHALASLLILLVTAASATAQRLPDIARPEHYTLWFAPDLQKHTFRGREAIRVQIVRPTTVVTLHAAEIAFGPVRITAGGQTHDAQVALHPESETVTLSVPSTLPAGPASIAIEYTGILNDKLRGFYLSEANGRAYAVSQMEATDARRAFPGFDEPAFKATFDITLMIDEGDTAISNGAQISDTPGPEPGKHTVAFATTKPMSTYLVALLVGDFVCRSSTADGVPLRVCATPDKLQLTGFALEAAAQQLAFYNDYYGIPYPFGKLDIVGVPDFAAGAMENVGAITFREQLLLADPERASLETKKAVAGVLSHEIAHQWFGNLVTMVWWDDIWLNEGFATWMANKPLAAWRPDWHVEIDEVVETQRALSLDTLRSTRAIRTKVETPEQINEVFDAIAYEKSAAVLRMVESYAGPDAFRQGVASYLKKFSYANAVAEDFWNEVARVSGKPVDRVIASYVDQPGVPMLGVSSRCAESTTQVGLRQDRFVGLPNPPPPAQQWVIPVCMKTGEGNSARCEVMATREETFSVPGCSADLFVNAGSVGYFITEYTPDAARTLTGRASTLLTPSERVGFLGDEWWMVRGGRHDIGVFLDLSAALAGDPTAAVTDSIATRVRYTAGNLVEDADRAGFAGWIGSRFGPQLRQLGLPGAGDPDELQQSRRAVLLELVGVWGDDRDLQRRARELGAQYMSDPASLPGTLVPAVLRVAAYGGDAALYEQYMKRIEQSASNPEEYYRFFYALPEFRDRALIDRTLTFALSPDVRSQDTASLIASVLANPWGRDQAWAFVKHEWAALTDKLGAFQGIPIIVGATGNLCSADATSDVKKFFAEHPVPAAERTLQQAIERIEGCVAVKARQGRALKTWLTADSRQ